MLRLRNRNSGWNLLGRNAGVGFLLLIFSGPVLLAQQPVKGTFTPIDIPGATYTRALGINAEGTVVGNYKDANGNSHGFVLSDDGFVTIDYPGALFTAVTGINDWGTIVGDYCPIAPCGPINTYHGFMVKDGNFTSFSFPGHKNLYTAHINDREEIAGCYHDDDLMASMHGFLLTDGNFSGFDVPASMHNAKSLDGTVVGLFFDPSLLRYRAYTLRHDEFSAFDFPSATLTWAWDINEKGEIVGEYADASGGGHGFLRNEEGFFSIDYPGAVSTSRGAINSGGSIVGQYIDANNHVHGFLLTRHQENNDEHKTRR
jgi:probable HAF family extracellular repeat protein